MEFLEEMEYIGDIPEGWKWVKLGDVVTLQRGYDLPKSKMEKGNIPVVGSNGIIGYHNKATTKAPGITIGRSGNIGNVYLYKSDFWAHNTTLYVKDFKGNDVIFLFYLLKNIDFKQLNAGSAVPTLNRNHIYPIEVKIPIKIEEQKAIADVLSSIDDKIELLHRQNKTLEEMAMTLFRQWFIDANFDGTIGQIVNVQGGYAFKSKDFKLNGNHSVIKIKNITNSIVNINDTEFIDESVVENLDTRFKISSGDILIAMTGAEIGKLGIVPKTNKNLWLNQRVGLLREKYEGARFIAYLHLKSEFGYDYIINAASGSAQANISASDIENCPFVQLSENEIKSYSKTISPFFEKIIFNLGQIQTLEKLRDTLLPKLMSGEVKII